MFYVYHPVFWELLSILSLTMFGLFWFIERISTKKYPMTKLMGLFIVVAASMVLWVRLKLVTPSYEVNGLVDLMLLAAMLCVALHFLVLVLRACNIQFARKTEKRFFFILLFLVVLYAIYLYFFGSQIEFAKLGMMVDRWIRPTWILVVLTLIAQIKWQR